MVRLTAVIIAAALPEQLGALPRGPTPRGGSPRPRPPGQRGQLPHDRDLRESNTTKTAAVAAGSCRRFRFFGRSSRLSTESVPMTCSGRGPRAAAPSRPVGR